MVKQFGGRRRGNALLEFLLLLPFFGTLFFGTLEFGMIFNDRIQLNNACRAGVRLAATGDTLAAIRSGIRNSHTSLGITDNLIVVERNDSINGTGSWVAASDNAAGTGNDIQPGYLCRVRIVDWPHRMLTGTFFNWLPGVSGSNLLVDSQQIMMHE